MGYTIFIERMSHYRIIRRFIPKAKAAAFFTGLSGFTPASRAAMFRTAITAGGLLINSELNHRHDSYENTLNRQNENAQRVLDRESNERIEMSKIDMEIKKLESQERYQRLQDAKNSKGNWPFKPK